jgi:hypothetical protein
MASRVGIGIVQPRRDIDGTILAQTQNEECHTNAGHDTGYARDAESRTEGRSDKICRILRIAFSCNGICQMADCPQAVLNGMSQILRCPLHSPIGQLQEIESAKTDEPCCGPSCPEASQTTGHLNSSMVALPWSRTQARTPLVSKRWP